MNVTDAVQTAKKYIAEVFSGETIIDIGVEEVEFVESKQTWKITIGFFRPWDREADLPVQLSNKPAWRKRTFKVVEIDDESGRPKQSMTIRTLPSLD